MIIGEPNCQTASATSVHSEKRGLEIQAGPWMPKTARSLLTRPSPAKSCRHSTAIATEAPSSDGR